MKMNLNKRGEGTYIDTVVFVLVAVIFIAFILNLFSIISAKQQLDVCADQLTRQIQLAGEVNSTTDSLFQSLCGDMESVSDIAYTVDTTYHSGRRSIQMNEYIYPQNLKSLPKLWLWSLRDIAVIGISMLFSVLALTQIKLFLPLAITLAYESRRH